MNTCRKCRKSSPLMYLVSGAWLCHRCRRLHYSNGS